MDNGFHRQAVRNQLQVLEIAKTARSYANLKPLDGTHTAHVAVVMSSWDKAFVSKVGKAAQMKLISITEKRMGRRPDGGGRALLQFVSFAFLHGRATKHWPNTIKGREKESLILVRSITQAQGATLLKGHDTVPTYEDMQLAFAILKEFAAWCSTELSLKALEAFFRAVKKEVPKFVASVSLRLDNPAEKKQLQDKKFAADYFAKVCVEQVRELSSFAPSPSNAVAAWLSHLVKLVW